MTFAPIKGQCPVCRQDAGLNLDPIVSFSESKQLAELRAENASLKEVISLSEDSRLMDEYLKLERANARQAERIKELDAETGVLRTKYEAFSDQQHTIAAQAAEIERERAARKTAQESLERYKGECTRLQHEVDRNARQTSSK